MPLAVQALWDALTAAGGAVALTLIVAIALGINALTLLFMGSAVVALERFARAVRRPGSVAGFGLVWAALVGAGAVYWIAPELSAEPIAEQLRRWVAIWARATLAVVLASGGVWLLLRWTAPRRLAAASLVLLGGGYALLTGGTGRLVYGAAPALVALAGALALAWRRRRRPGASRGESERLLGWLAGSLLLGPLLAALLPESAPRVAAAGAWLLAGFGAAVLLGLVPLAAAGLLDARQSAEWFIAMRYLVAKRRQTFISVITGICVVGIAAGVWLIITVLSVMNGFERTWRDEIIGNRAHFTVQSGLGPFADYRDVLAEVEATPGVVGAAPFLEAQGMVRGSTGHVVAVQVRGVDPARVGLVTDLGEDLISGSLEALAQPGEDGAPGILVGSQLAASLGAMPGETLLLVSPFGGPQTPLGPAPRLKRFRVAGVFESSFFQYDEMFTYVTLEAARDFRGADDVVDGIEARTTDFYRSAQVASEVQRALGFPFYTRDWKEFFPAFFQALKSERVMMFVLLTMIMVVAAFAIVSTLVMMIMEKSGDIAILKAMGAQDDGIERIFAIEGTLIGLVGTALGVVAGLSVTAQIEWIQQQIEAVTGIDTLPASVYQFSTLPAELDFGQIAIVVAMAMILSLGATLLPSRQAARLDPVEALRYE